MHMIKAMMSGMIDEVTDQVGLDLFQTDKGKAASYKIWTMSNRAGVSANALLKEYRFDQVMSDYIYECNGYKVNPEDIPYYVNRLKLSFVKKKANEYIKSINSMVVDNGCSLTELIKILTNGINIELEGEENKRLVLDPEEYAIEHYNYVYEIANNPDVKKGIRIKSLPELDETFYGLQGGDFLMFCAQSGHGKTALALNISDDVAVEQKHRLYYANAEMNEKELSMRVASKRALVPAKETMSGIFEERPKDISLEALEMQYEIIKESGMYLSKIPHMSIKAIKRGFKKLENAGKRPEIIIVDYIGRMEATFDTKGMSEWQKLYQLAEDCKTLAVELDVPVIALAQLNEDGRIEGAKKMKNACDGVLFFEPVTEEDDKYMNPEQKKFANYKMIKYKVRRNDNSKPIYINFTKKYQRITEVS